MDTLLFAIVVLSLMSYAGTCGPGGGYKGKSRRRLMPGKSLPPTVFEDTGFASGKFVDCSELVQILATHIVFKDPAYKSDTRMTTKVRTSFFSTPS
jgi:hypothetical protein